MIAFSMYKQLTSPNLHSVHSRTPQGHYSSPQGHNSDVVDRCRNTDTLDCITISFRSGTAASRSPTAYEGRTGGWTSGRGARRKDCA